MNYKSWFAAPLMRANRFLAPRFRKSRLLTKLLFGINPTGGDRPQYWDYTTLVLKKALKTYGSDGVRTLEIGVGENAVLSQYLCKQYNVDATGVDLDGAVVECARQSAQANQVEIDLKQSDMFSACEGKFDLIFWNPPYVPSDAPDDGLVGKQTDLQSDGGFDGVAVIREFLKRTPERLNDGGRVLLGFSAFYVSLETMKDAVAESGLRIEEIVASRPNPSKVLVLKHA